MWWFESTVDSFKGFNLSDLGIDEAWLNISSSFSQPLWLYILSDNCHQCPFQKLIEEPILPNHSYKTKVNVQHGSLFRFRSSGNSTYAPSFNDSMMICEVPSNFGEFGVYSLHAEDKHSPPIKCTLEVDLAPVNTYLPILATFAFWLLLCFTWLNWGESLSRAFLRRWSTFHGSPAESDENEALLNVDNKPVPINNSEISDGNEFSSSDGKSPSKPGPESSVSTARTPSKTRKRITNAKTKAKRRSSRPLTKSTDDASSQAPINPEHQVTVPSTSGSSQIQSAPVTVTVLKQVTKERLKSLDVFRGLSIVIMIFADDGGGGYYFFQHCTWDGLYVADFAFPWFLWICGVCIPFSINSKIIYASSSSKLQIFIGILQRSLKLIFLGIMVNTSTRADAVQLENLRLPGVLQRFGVCYFVGSTLYLLLCSEACAKKLSLTQPDQPRSGQQGTTGNGRNYFEDLKVSSMSWLLVLLCVALHTSLIILLPVPNCPTGYLGPAGLHNNGTFPASCVGGAAGYIDRLIFGIQHIHNRPTSHWVYGSGAFDPEGSLGILTSILQVWLGVQTGIILLLYKNANERLTRFLVWSCSIGLMGGFLCGGYLNQGWIPVNKNLWSLSFVLVTSSAALFLLSFLYFVIDVMKLWSGRPLLETGMNSIFLYLAHELCHAVLPWHYSYGRMRTHCSRIVESSWGTVLWILVALWLHKRQWFFIV